MVSRTSLIHKAHELSDPAIQKSILNSDQVGSIPLFKDKLQDSDLFPLHPTSLDILQVNVGKMCNQTCKHCHVDAGPDRTEIMTRETMQQCLDALKTGEFSTLDLTGGAPELNPDFRWFVEQASGIIDKIIVRSNLTIIVSNKRFYDLPVFFAKHNVEIVSSLPFYSRHRTDSQRGEGVFDASVKALKMLNKAGYGSERSNLTLNLVYNPTGCFLPGNQCTLENEFKNRLSKEFGINFNKLLTITNMPISRFLEYLLRSGNLEDYMDRLVESYNPTAAAGVMCRDTLSVSWDGFLFDCDFNQMLDIKIQGSYHISRFNAQNLLKREVILDQHCYGCTAGSGSSCKGSISTE